MVPYKYPQCIPTYWKADGMKIDLKRRYLHSFIKTESSTLPLGTYMDTVVYLLLYIRFCVPQTSEWTWFNVFEIILELKLNVPDIYVRCNMWFCSVISPSLIHFPFNNDLLVPLWCPWHLSRVCPKMCVFTGDEDVPHVPHWEHQCWEQAEGRRETGREAHRQGQRHRLQPAAVRSRWASTATELCQEDGEDEGEGLFGLTGSYWLTDMIDVLHTKGIYTQEQIIFRRLRNDLLEFHPPPFAQMTLGNVIKETGRPSLCVQSITHIER